MCFSKISHKLKKQLYQLIQLVSGFERGVGFKNINITDAYFHMYTMALH